MISAPAITASRSMFELNSTKIPFEINQQQLLLNYHFGQKNSSTLFFPLNHAFAINHNSKRKISGKAPNVRVQFSTDEKRSRYFLERSLSDLKKVRHSKLSYGTTASLSSDAPLFFATGKIFYHVA